MEELGSSLCANHCSGYVAVLGKPNVGKSTLINQMVGQKLSAVTDKPQTNRHCILGIYVWNQSTSLQIILYDTAGVIEKEMHEVDSMIMKNVRSAIGSADSVFGLLLMLAKHLKRLMKCLTKVWETKILDSLYYLY
ncbi:hypothetical protein BDA96_10G127400 [Sorghum bicolor]|uniref:G domain-containing protein n=2 Tax=Sorghum bicolor TaxID=4558 RepID=A0A921U0I3_SORBI|nr:hypothetical protein SORBI_3010G104000 [Sorghum bicolor]EER89534.1 hypothetical protein SORBI_3010G104000 [Sorghum bicolor]KAG0513729.1 hypothetical protein BDA96_10G127400 [Sorghum bicolor]KAG0513730.1 hypothetical protein BDA96_10G127400 [Sorghum bicolor]